MQQSVARLMGSLLAAVAAETARQQLDGAAAVLMNRQKNVI
jgi:hypothetical protein